MNISGKFIVFSLVVVLSVGACSGLTRSDKPATRTWWLKPYAALGQERAVEPPVLVAITTTVVPGLDTDRILTLSGDAELNQFAAARWADNLPELVTSLVGRTLEASGRFEVVSERAGGASENCNLQLKLQEFFAHLSASSQTTGVRVVINGRFQCGSEEPVSISLHTHIPVHDARISVIVAAFQQAMDAVMREMLVQIP